MSKEVKDPPYLQLTLDAKRKAALVAKAVGVEPGGILWGLTDLWEHVWRTKSDVTSTLVLAGCFGPDSQVLEALSVYGFLEPAESQWRVRGAAKRLFGQRVSGSRGGKKAAENGQSLRNLKQFQPKACRSDTEGAFGNSDENHRTTPKPSQQPAAIVTTANAVVEPLVSVVPSEKPKKPTTKHAQFAEWTKARRTAAFPEAPAESVSKPAWIGLAKLLDDHGRVLAEAAWQLFEADGYAKDAKWPLNLFASQWPRWLAKAQGPAPNPVREAAPVGVVPNPFLKQVAQ